MIKKILIAYMTTALLNYDCEISKKNIYGCVTGALRIPFRDVLQNGIVFNDAKILLSEK